MTDAIEKLVSDYQALRSRAELAESREQALLEQLARCQPGVAEAQRDAALDALRALVKQLERIGGYATAREQADLREARALLVEAGR